jgi:hypothetical protein
MKHPKPERLVVIEGTPIYIEDGMISATDVIKQADTYNCALSGGVSPRLIVAGEHPKVASTNELLIVEPEDRVVTVQKVRVEDNLDAIVVMVEQFDTPNLVQNRVVGIVRHVVCDHRGERIPFQGENPAFQ